MSGGFDPAYIAARAILLDGLLALRDHADGLVLVGAHAVYLHTGAAGMAIAEYTTDADLAIDPDLIAAEPMLGEVLAAHGFSTSQDLGRWIGPSGLFLDLLVPESLAGSTGRRSADLGVHGRRIARRVAGLEGSLVDNRRETVKALALDDGREFTVKVAGPAALLIAKAIKIEERIDNDSRRSDKDALDVLRLLRTVETAVLAPSFRDLLASPLASGSAERALGALPHLFSDPDSPGCQMAARSVQLLEDPMEIATSLSILTLDLVAAIESSGHQ